MSATTPVTPGPAPGGASEGGRPFAVDFPVTLTAVIRPEPGGRFSARVPALPGCFTEGDTLDELRANLAEAAQAWAESARAALLVRREALGLLAPSVEGMTYVDLAPLQGHPGPTMRPDSDLQGPTPAFPPLKLDEQGRIVPLGEAEIEARYDAASSALENFGREAGAAEDEGLARRVFRDIDEGRPHRPLFGEGP